MPEQYFKTGNIFVGGVIREWPADTQVIISSETLDEKRFCIMSEKSQPKPIHGKVSEITETQMQGISDKGLACVIVLDERLY